MSSRSCFPLTVTSATPASDRSSRVMAGSAMRVSSAAESRSECRAIDMTGRSVSFNFLMIGSSISAGRSARTSEMASRMSWVASARGLSKANSIMIQAKPSWATPLTVLTPAIPAICSSTGSSTSRSTMSGEAPGYGIATET